MDTVSEYVRNLGQTCPNCKSELLLRVDHHAARGSCSVKVKCKLCGTTWAEHYNLGAYTIRPTPKEEDQVDLVKKPKKEPTLLPVPVIVSVVADGAGSFIALDTEGRTFYMNSAGSTRWELIKF